MSLLLFSEKHQVSKTWMKFENDLIMALLLLSERHHTIKTWMKFENFQVGES